MDSNKDMMKETMDLLGSLRDDAMANNPLEMKRDSESIDDFEHLGHDSSPVKPVQEVISKEVEPPLFHGTREGELGTEEGVIDKRVASTLLHTEARLADDLLFDPVNSTPAADPFSASSNKMDSNLLDLSDGFPDRKEADAKLDKFLSDMKGFSNPSEMAEKDDASKKPFFDEEEHVESPEKPLEKKLADDGVLEHYSDSDPEDDMKHPEPPKTVHDVDDVFQHATSKFDAFKDLDDFEKFDTQAPEPQPLFKTPEPPVEPLLPEVPCLIPEPEPPKPQKVEEKPKVREAVEEIKAEVAPKQVKKNVIEAEAMFCKMGLDAWFDPQRLDPRVESLIYWRDPKKSGPVFGAVLLILLSLKFFSLISVVAYVSLLALAGTIAFRIYKNVVQAIQKTGEGNPFNDYLSVDLKLPEQKVEELTKIAVAHANAFLFELRRLFLVDDLVDSIKFGVLLWCCTYVGAWFNGITLIILAWVLLFSLPKVYETNKTQIDANLDIVKSKLAEITTKVKAAIPIGKKPEEKKE